MALKLYYKEMLGQSFNLEYLFPNKKPGKLPVVIAKEDILKIIEKANNIRHKSMIALTYSAGLRVGELIELKIRDIDSSGIVIHIKSGKGNRAIQKLQFEQVF